MTENTHRASSDHQRGDPLEPEWTSHLADLENSRQALMWRFAPEDPDEYCKVDQAHHLLAEVLLAQEQRRRSADHK